MCNPQKNLLTLLTVVMFMSNAFSQAGNSKIANRLKPLAQTRQYHFIHFLPDTALAMLVAERLNKPITEKVTVKELASIKGYFQVWPSQVASLKGIGYLIGIDSFDCNKNDVTVLPAEIGQLKNLVWLDLTKAFSLESIPEDIGKLKKLKYLGIALTEVKVIPKEIGNLINLQSLELCCNTLTSIPKEIGNLTNLTDLDIHSNNIGKLPDEICNLTSLTSLDISYCGLKKLPENIGNLRKLEILNLFSNDIKHLPNSIVQLSNLTSLNVYDNFALSEGYKKHLPKLLKLKYQNTGKTN